MHRTRMSVDQLNLRDEVSLQDALILERVQRNNTKPSLDEYDGCKQENNYGDRAHREAIRVWIR